MWEVAAGCEQFIEEYPNKFHQFASGSLVWGDWEEYTVPAIPLELRDMYIENYYENPNPRYDRDFSKLVNFLEDEITYDKLVNVSGFNHQSASKFLENLVLIEYLIISICFDLKGKYKTKHQSKWL